MDVFDFRGFEIPVELVPKTGGGPETFEAISEQRIWNLNSQHTLSPGMRVLEIGCGIGRDAIPLTSILGPAGSYIGTDVIRESIDWCSSAIGSRHPNFEFHWHDIKDSLHNPDGRLEFDQVRLPADDGSIDLVFAQSVFTHLLPEAFAHFLSEAARVVRPGGTVYATCFRVDGAILERARASAPTQYALSFAHQHADGCWVNELDHLTGAVAYDDGALSAFVAASGLVLRGPVRAGAWSGHHPVAFDGQDVLVLGRDC